MNILNVPNKGIVIFCLPAAVLTTVLTVEIQMHSLNLGQVSFAMKLGERILAAVTPTVTEEQCHGAMAVDTFWEFNMEPVPVFFLSKECF